MKKFNVIRRRTSEEDLNSLFEALEWGTDDMVSAYKKATPGEFEEDTTLTSLKKMFARTVGRKKYDVAADILKKVWDRKNKETNNNPRHSLDYYASRVAQSLKGIETKPLIDIFKRNFATEAYELSIELNMPLHSIYRPHSTSYYLLFNEAREMNLPVEGLDKYLIEQTDIGKWDMFEGQEVPLDIPLVEEKDVELNKPKRGGSKKFYVYVKNDKGNVVKVSFGDTSGLKAKINDPAARKSFVARHDCENKKDKTKAGYWACRLPMYAKELGLEGGGDFFW